MARKDRTPQGNLFRETAINNKRSYIYYLDRITELALSRFKWNGLPESVDERYLENVLFFQGRAIFFKDEILDWLALKLNLTGNFDVYGIPTDRIAFADNGYQRHLNKSDSVIIWNNYVRKPTYPNIQIYAARLALLDQIINVNANAQKTPVLIKASEKERLTMLNLYEKYDGNQPYIFGTDDLDSGKFTVLSTAAPYVCDKINELKSQLWNELLTMLGIPNINTNTRERMVTDQVQRAQGGVFYSRFSPLLMRQKAAEEMSKLSGLEITCEMAETVGESVNMPEPEEETEEGAEDEQIYN